MPRGNLMRWCLLGVTALTFVPVATTASGQVFNLQINPGGINAAGTPADGKDAAGVYVRDSGAAMDELALGQKMERLSEWAKAADIFQEIQEKYPDRVVATDTDKNNIVRGYTSVQLVVQDELSSWPTAGLEVYRSRFGPKAQTLLDQAGRGDLATLNLVYNRYFVTDAGRKAGILLQNAYIESGAFAAAAVVGNRLLEHHKNLGIDRPAILYRTAQAMHLAGDDAGAKKWVAELHDTFPANTGVVRGSDIVLADSLMQVLAVSAPPRASASGDSYRTMGGDETRSLIPAGAAQPGAKLFSIDLTHNDIVASNPPNAQAVAQNQQRVIINGQLIVNGQGPAAAQQATQNRQRQLQGGSMLGVMPAIDQGQLFFQDNTHLFAVDLDSGIALPGWAATYPGAGAYSIGAEASGVPPNQQLTVTVTDSSVLAVMGAPDSNDQMFGTRPVTTTRLVNLDRRTGKLLWAASPAGLPNNSSQPLQSLQFGGAPLVVSDNVYIVGSGAKGGEFTECYVICFDLATGAFRWASYIASSDASANPYGMVMPTMNVASLAYSDGRVFVSTNLGAAAAVDAFDGAIDWLRIYRDPQDQNTGDNNLAVRGMVIIRPGMNVGGLAAATTSQSKPIYVNPALVRDGNVFVCPMDSRNIMVYSVDDGHEIARIDRKALHAAVAGSSMNGVTIGDNAVTLNTDPAVLIGVSGDTMYLGFHDIVVAVDWRVLQAGKPKGDWEKWAGTINDDLSGRPMMTDARMYIPECSKPAAGAQGAEHAFLAWRNIRGGMLLDTYPADGSWTTPHGPGNVLVSGDHVVIAGETSVDVYTDLDSVERKLDQQMTAAPGDPEIRLKYAEVLFAAGLSDQCAAKLDEAISLMGGTAALRNGASRDRLFSSAMTFAQRLVQKTSTPDNNRSAMIGAFYDRAGQAASTPAQMVRYRLERADWQRHSGDYEAAITLYQEILTDPALSAVTVVTPQDAQSNGSIINSSASAAAADRIKDILASGGAKAAEAYARFDAAAQQRFDQAANDPAAFLAVAQMYPNSKVAQPALFAAADQFEATGNPAQAGRVLRRIEVMPHSAKVDQQLLESIARNAFAVPSRVDIGVARLAEAASLFPNVHLAKSMRLPDGTVLLDVSFQQAYDAARKYSSDLSQASLADMSIPWASDVAKLRAEKKPVPPPFLPADAAGSVDDISNLVQPIANFGRNDRVAGWSQDSKLRVFTVGSNHPSFTLPLNQTPHNLAYMGNRLCAWSDTEVAAALWDAGTSPWKFELSSLPDAAVLSPAQAVTVAPEIAPNPPPIAPPDNAIVNWNGGFAINGNGVMVLNGGFAANGPAGLAVPAGPQAPPGAGGETITAARPLSDRLIFATSTGRVFALAVSDGHVLWQSRVRDMAIDKLVASDDFVVLRSTAIDGSNIALTILDADSGAKLAEQKYAAQETPDIDLGTMGVPEVPINLALAGDGRLVWMMPHRLCMTDLYHPNLSQPAVMTPLDASQQPIFGTSNQPDQLLLVGGRILAVSDDGKFIRLYSLQNGSPIASPQPVSPPNQTARGHVGLSVAGSYLYAISLNTVMAYNLDSLANKWSTVVEVKPDIARVIIDKNYLLAMAGVGSPVSIFSWSRARVVPRAGQSAGVAIESGGVGFSAAPVGFAPPTLTDPAGIGDMQAVDGGLYYVTHDNKLKFARGARQP